MVVSGVLYERVRPFEGSLRIIFNTATEVILGEEYVIIILHIIFTDSGNGGTPCHSWGHIGKAPREQVQTSRKEAERG